MILFVTSEILFSSKSPSPIRWETHKKWFEKTLLNINSAGFIGRLTDGDKIGMCRFETNVIKKEINVSINLKKDYRGKKLSKVLLKTAIRHFKNKKKFCLTATIKKKKYIKYYMFQLLWF